MTDDERIVAFLDDELDDREREAFAALTREDAALARRVERHRRLKPQLGSAFTPAEGEPTPSTWREMILAAEDPRRRRSAVPAWAALAASVAVGVLAGRLAWPTEPVLAPGAPVEGEIAAALDRQAAATAAIAAPVRVGLSFRRADGRYCRTFTSTPDGIAGLACRDDEGWRTQTVTAWRPAPEAAYRQLAAATPPAVLAAVDELIVGSPLSAEEEARARARAWRR